MQNLILSLIVVFTLSSCLSDTATFTDTSKDDSINLFRMMNEAHYAFEQQNYPFYLFKMKTICDIAPEFPYFIFEKAKAHLVNNQIEACLDELAKLVALDSPMSLRIETDPVFQVLESNSRFQGIIANIDKEQKPIVNSEKAYELLAKKGRYSPIMYNPTSKSLMISLSGKTVRNTQDSVFTDFIKYEQHNINGIYDLAIDKSTNNLWASVMVSDSIKKTQYSAVCQFNSTTGKLIKSFVLNDNSNHAFTHLTIVNGDIYITDCVFKIPSQLQNNELYVIRQSSNGVYKKIEPFVTSHLLQIPNSITSDAQNLYIAMQYMGVFKINIDTKTIKRVTPNENLTLTGITNLEYYNGHLIAVQPDILGGIFKYKLEGDNVVKRTTIERYHPMFNLPSFSVIVEDDLYYIADKKLGEDEVLKTVTILKTKLTN